MLKPTRRVLAALTAVAAVLPAAAACSSAGSRAQSAPPSQPSTRVDDRRLPRDRARSRIADIARASWAYAAITLAAGAGALSTPSRQR